MTTVHKGRGPVKQKNYDGCRITLTPLTGLHLSKWTKDEYWTNAFVSLSLRGMSEKCQRQQPYTNHNAGFIVMYMHMNIFLDTPR